MINISISSMPKRCVNQNKGFAAEIAFSLTTVNPRLANTSSILFVMRKVP